MHEYTVRLRNPCVGITVWYCRNQPWTTLPGDLSVLFNGEKKLFGEPISTATALPPSGNSFQKHAELNKLPLNIHEAKTKGQRKFTILLWHILGQLSSLNIQNVFKSHYIPSLCHFIHGLIGW